MHVRMSYVLIKEPSYLLTTKLFQRLMAETTCLRNYKCPWGIWLILVPIFVGQKAQNFNNGLGGVNIALSSRTCKILKI